MIQVRQNAELDVSVINDILRMMKRMLIGYIAFHACLLVLFVLYIVLSVAFCAFIHNYECGNY